MENELQGSFTVGLADADLLRRVKEGRIALLDADYMKYIFMSRMNTRVQEELSESEDRSQAILEVYDDVLFGALGKFEDPILFCFSGKSYNTFRYHLANDREYKGNRKRQEFYEGCFDDLEVFMSKILAENTCLLFDDLEADDIVSALQGDDTYIVSNDKDLNQIPGMHYNFATHSTYMISEEEGALNLAMQIVMGDVSDNVPGIKGMGVKSAEKLFKDVDYSELFQVAQSAYLQKYGFDEGLYRYSEAIQLVKLKGNYGAYFMEKYHRMFQTKDAMKLYIEKPE